MSLVGPRPLPLRDHALLRDWHKARYNVLPGMTGLWQISGRSGLDFDDLVRLDFTYLENWSIWLDVTIIAKTIPAVLTGSRGRGAFRGDRGSPTTTSRPRRHASCSGRPVSNGPGKTSLSGFSGRHSVSAPWRFVSKPGKSCRFSLASSVPTIANPGIDDRVVRRDRAVGTDQLAVRPDRELRRRQAVVSTSPSAP